MERRVVFKSNIDRTIRAEKHAEQDKGEKHRDAELVRDTVQNTQAKITMAVKSRKEVIGGLLLQKVRNQFSLLYRKEKEQ